MQRGRNPPKKEEEFTPKERSKEELRQWESTFLMINSLLKNHNRNSVTAAFSKIRIQVAQKKKYSQFLANKLHLLQRRKARENQRWAVSGLVSNRISYYAARKQQNDKTKENMRNKAVLLMAIIQQKQQKSKLTAHFHDLRSRASLKAKLTTFKVTHLVARLSAMLASRARDGLRHIGKFGKFRLTGVRRISRIEKLINNKSKGYLMSGLSRLRLNAIKLRNKEEPEKEEPAKTPAKTPVTSKALEVDKEAEAEIRRLESEQKALADKKKNLEKELSRAESESDRVLTEFRNQIKRLESENEELGFNNGLLQESNQELEREFQSRQKSTRKKLSKAEIWENVYNNLIFFLNTTKQQPISKAALLECLEVPLVPCGINLDELNDENRVLEELLQEYRNNFPPPEGPQEQPEMLPFDVIRKQNRYYYMVLEVLSEWGASGSRELDQLNSDLTSLQKKLNP